MWRISQDEAVEYKVLKCLYNFRKNTLVKLDIYCKPKTILFQFDLLDTVLCERLVQRINRKLQVYRLASLEFTREASSLKFSTDISSNLLQFYVIIEQLSETIAEFSHVRDKLNRIIPVSNDLIQKTLAQQAQARNAEFATQKENTMHPLVFITARCSELGLRTAYNFPAPVYAMDMEEDADFEESPRVAADHTGLLFLLEAANARSMVPPPPPPPLTTAEAQEDSNSEFRFDTAEGTEESDSDEDAREVDYPDTPDTLATTTDDQFTLRAAPVTTMAETAMQNALTQQSSHSSTPSLALGQNMQYATEENDLINEFTTHLEGLRNKMFESGEVVINNGNFEPSAPMLNILRAATEAASHGCEKPANLDRAQYCMDVLVAIRAIYPEGSYASNSDMHLTKIYGYGLRNIVALLWHCIKTAASASPVRFMKGVTIDMAIEALIHGIANGARGKNRDEDSGIDNLEDEDERSCDMGRYNSLISAMQGIFAEVEIKYDYLELFMLELKKELYHLLLDITGDDYITALGLITNWSSKEPVPVHQYTNFVKIAKEKFPAMQTKFLDTIFANDPEYKGYVSKGLNNFIRDMELQGFGISFIEQISLSTEEYTAYWRKRAVMPVVTHDLQRPRTRARIS
jgi:hypothetical protein